MGWIQWAPQEENKKNDITVVGEICLYWRITNIITKLVIFYALFIVFGKLFWHS